MPGLQAALPAGYYIDEAHWRRERELVLFAEWFCVGRSDALPAGAVAAFPVAGESVLVARDRDGRPHGHYNVCRHRGCQLLPLAPGEAAAARRAGALRCPYHSWTYALDGRLLKAPWTDDVTDFDPAQFGLHPVAVAEWAGFLFVHLTPAVAGTLAAALGAVPGRLCRYPLDELRVGHRLRYRVAANWKVLAENYNECYHCAGVHPELCRLVPAFRRGGGGLDWEAGIPHRDGAWTFTATGTSSRAPFPGLDAQEATRHKGELVYPNLLLSLAAEHVAAFVLWPTGPAETVVDCELLFARQELAHEGFDPSDAAGFWDLVNRQDWAVCEAVQRGMSSRSYTGGWFAPMEDASADIRRWLLPRLGEAPPEPATGTAPAGRAAAAGPPAP